MNKVLVVLERRLGMKAGQFVLHVMEACPERLALTKGSFDLVEVDPVALGLLKARHVSCETCQQLDVASSADRVRFLLAGISRKAS